MSVRRGVGFFLPVRDIGAHQGRGAPINLGTIFPCWALP